MIPDRLTPSSWDSRCTSRSISDVAQRVAAAAPGGPAGRDQPEPVVGAQGLRVQARQLGGHRDDVDGRVVGQLERARSCHLPRLRLAHARRLACLRSRSSRGSLAGRGLAERLQRLPGLVVELLRHLHLDGDEQVAVGAVLAPDALAADPEGAAVRGASRDPEVTGGPAMRRAP